MESVLTTGKSRRVYAVSAAIVALLTIVVLYTRLAWTVPTNSDNAAAVLLAQDFIQGNFLLRGWTMGNISVYTTELPYYVMGLLVAGFTPSLLRMMPALLFTIVVALSMSLVYCEARARSPLHAMAVTFVLGALPWGFSPILLLAAFIHNGTIVMVLAALLCLSLVYRRSAGWWLFPLFLMFLTCAVLDDELAIYIGALPIISVLVLRIVFEFPRIKTHQIVLAVLAIVSVPLGREIADLIALSGGFAAHPPSAVVAPLFTLPQNISLAYRGILLLFGADPFDQFGNHRALLLQMAALIHWLGIILVAAATWRILTRWIKREDSNDLVPQIFVVGIAVDIACYLVSDRAANLATTRYLVPTLVYGSTVAGMAMPSWIFAGRGQWLAGVVAAVYCATFVAGMFAPRANQGELAVAFWLREHHLTEGYGDYWAAGILTAESGDSIRIRQVMASDDGYHPFLWMANEHWYEDAQHGDGFNFLILDGSNEGGVNEASALKFFGEPTQRYQVGGYKILVWNKKLPIQP